MLTSNVKKLKKPIKIRTTRDHALNMSCIFKFYFYPCFQLCLFLIVPLVPMNLDNKLI